MSPLKKSTQANSSKQEKDEEAGLPKKVRGKKEKLLLETLMLRNTSLVMTHLRPLVFSLLIKSKALQKVVTKSQT